MVQKVVGEIEVIAAEMFYVRDVHVMVDELTPGRLFQSLKSGLKEAEFQSTDVFGRTFTLEELIALYLSALRKRARALVGQFPHVYGHADVVGAGEREVQRLALP